MTTISLTRFNKTAGGYNRSDVSELQHGPDCEDTLTGLIRMMMDGSKKQPEAWSFCRFKSGKMCGDTWVDGSAVLLEYHQAKAAENAEARLQEIIEAANSLFHAFYIISSTTRYNQPTWTLVFPLSEKVNAKRYARIASVLATQLKLGRATSGIQSHTHLIHVNADSWAQYKPGFVINPDFFIKTTAHEAQVFDPTQFERKKPFAAAQIEPPTNTSADPGLFDWG